MGLPFFKKEYPHLVDRIAAGRVSGSDITGADDEWSHDHDCPWFELFICQCLRSRPLQAGLVDSDEFAYGLRCGGVTARIEDKWIPEMYSPTARRRRTHAAEGHLRG